MHLAQPWGLLALAALPIIVLLYSLRPRRRNVAVSSLALWSEALRERQRGLGLQKLLRNLSLLALLLTALAIALALADPGWVSRAARPGDTVLIIDVSASMQARDGGTTRFERAMREAHARVDALPDGARMLIIASGREARLLSAFESDKEVLRHALSGLEPSDEAGRPRNALTLALSLQRNREQGRILFLTDAAFDERLDFAGAKVEYHVVGSPARNVAITRFDLRREPGGEERFQLLLVLRNYTGETIEVPVRVRLDEKPLLARKLNLPPQGRETLVSSFLGRASGRAGAHVDHDDDLAADNHAFAVLGVDQPLRIALYTPGNFYLESALAALPDARLSHYDALGPELPRVARTHDLVVIDGMPAPPLPRGAYLLIDALASGLPFEELDAPLRNPVVEGRGASALVRDLALSDLRIDEARRVAIEDRSTGLRRLFWSAEGPLALSFAREDLRVVYLGFDVRQSNFPLQATFPLFVQRSAAWLRGAGPRFSPTRIAAGEPYLIRVPVGQESLLVRRPDGEAGVHEVQGGALLFDATSKAGIYRYTQEDPYGEIHRYFAVNPSDEAESNLEPRAALAAAAPAPGEESALPARSTIALWPLLAAIALLLLAVEGGAGLGRRRGA